MPDSRVYIVKKYYCIILYVKAARPVSDGEMCPAPSIFNESNILWT